MKIGKKNKDYDIEFFLKKVAESASINDDGNMTYKGFEASEMMRMVQFFVKFPEAAAHLNHAKLTSRAFKHAFNENDFSEQYFFKELKQVIIAELQKPDQTFYVLTSVSIDIKALEQKAFKINDCNLVFRDHSYSNMFSGRQEVLDSLISEHGECKELSHYTRVEIQVKSRHKKEAFNRAIQALNIFRAFCAIHLNSTGMIAGDYTKPINKVCLGKVHTLHDDSGKAFSFPAFYEPDFREIRMVAKPPTPEVFQKNINTYLTWLKACPFSRKMENFLERFVLALDQPDKNTSVLKLWALLEQLIGEGNCDLLAKRIAAMHKEKEVTHHIIMHIREYRNEHVHQGIGDDESIHRAYYLQNMFRNMFDFYISPANNFASITEANMMLDKMALGADGIKNQIGSLKQSLKFLGEDSTE